MTTARLFALFGRSPAYRALGEIEALGAQAVADMDEHAAYRRYQRLERLWARLYGGRLQP